MSLVPRVFVSLAALVASFTLSCDPSDAKEHPVQTAWLISSVQTAAPGDSVSFTASGFAAGTVVTVRLMSPVAVALGTFTAYDDGIGVVTVNVPMDASLGDNSVSADGVDPHGHALSVSTPFGVVAKAAEFDLARSARGGLAADVVVPACLLAILAGSLFAASVRKKRRFLR